MFALLFTAFLSLQPLPESSNPKDSTTVDETVVQSLVASLGAFTAEQVRAALRETSGAADRAADWLFSHMDDLDGAIAALSGEVTGGTGPRELKQEDADVGKYTLTGMISHIGRNTGSGHYVAHLKKDGKWVIFNDEKVALSSKPPFQHAYLYLFQRTDTIQSLSPNF
jgi:ubiquitin carboxyl-terminal hydrolase 5/13